MVDALAIAMRLREISLYYGIDGDPHRSRAYDRAAHTVEAIHDLERRIMAGTLTELPGIGDKIAAAVVDFHERGSTGILDKLRAKWTPIALEIAQLQGIGPVKARKLVDALKPRDLDDLAAMCEAARVREVPGFGKTSEARLLEAIRNRHDREDGWLLTDTRRVGGALAGYFATDPAALAVEICGPARRWQEVCDRIVLVIATREPAAIRDRLRGCPLVLAVDESDPTIARARLADGGRCDVHAVAPEQLGAALVIATGSDAHVAQLRDRAAAGGIDLGTLAAADEAAVYRALGLPWLPPEIRDGSDELALAAGGESFADLIALGDITGAVHCHTHHSDGRHSVEEMARAAVERGHQFITITDHSVSAHYAGGLDEERLRAQWVEIADVQRRVPIKILRGTESDILADGALDFRDEVLGELDIVIASIHVRHKQDSDAMTTRLVNAMAHPMFKIWGHALGRMLLRRDPVDCRFDDVLDTIEKSRAAIEINGDPHRLDLDPERAKQARARGIKFTLSVDAHSIRELGYVDNAVAMARRARLRKSDVLNTLPADDFAAAVRPAG